MKFRYVPSLALPLACAPQQELIDSRHPEKPPIACPSKLEERITCIKKAIAQTGTLEDAQSFCEGKPLILCQIDVMQKHVHTSKVVSGVIYFLPIETFFNNMIVEMFFGL